MISEPRLERTRLKATWLRGLPDFRLNQVVLRAEMRAEVAVWRPSGFIVVTEASE